MPILVLTLQELACWCLENQPPQVWVNYGTTYDLAGDGLGTEDRLAIFAGTMQEPRAVALIGHIRAYRLVRLFNDPLSLLALAGDGMPKKPPP